MITYQKKKEKELSTVYETTVPKRIRDEVEARISNSPYLVMNDANSSEQVLLSANAIQALVLMAYDAGRKDQHEQVKEILGA